MITKYIIAVAHEEGVEPDLYVNAVELVVNRLVRLEPKDLTATEWLPEIIAQVGKVAAAQLRVTDIMKGENPDTSVPDEINIYLDSLLDVCTVTLLALSSLTRKVKHDAIHTNEHSGMGQDSSDS